MKTAIREIILGCLDYLQSIREKEGMKEVYIQPSALFQRCNYTIVKDGLGDNAKFKDLRQFQDFINNYNIELPNGLNAKRICVIRHKEPQLELDSKTNIYTYSKMILGYSLVRKDDTKTAEYLFHDCQFHLVDAKRRTILNEKKRKMTMGTKSSPIKMAFDPKRSQQTHLGKPAIKNK